MLLRSRLAKFGLGATLLLEKYSAEDITRTLRLTLVDMCTLGLTHQVFVQFRSAAFSAMQIMHVWQSNWQMILAHICDGDLIMFLGSLGYTAADLRTMGFMYVCTEPMYNFSLDKLEEAYSSQKISIPPEDWFAVLGMPCPPKSSSWRPAWNQMYAADSV